jgi:hypothetical protein
MAAMSGAQIPTTQTQTATGSPLSLISGLSSIGMGLYKPYTDAAGKVTTIADQIGLGSLASGAKTAIGGAYDYAKNAVGLGPTPAPVTGTPYDDNGNLNPGWEIVGSNPVFTGNNIPQDPGSLPSNAIDTGGQISGGTTGGGGGLGGSGYFDYSDPANPVWIST